MNPWHAVLLAVVQGITELIPVISSAHLILVPFFLGWKDQGLDFDIATNTGTLIAVLVYFRRDVRDLVVGFFTNQPLSGDGVYHPRRLACLRSRAQSIQRPASTTRLREMAMSSTRLPGNGISAHPAAT